MDNTFAIHRLADEVEDFTVKTMGPDNIRGPLPVVHHIHKEVQELLFDPYDIEEYADMLILILDGSRRAGYDTQDLLEAAFNKMIVNRKRKWGKPDENGVVEHIRD